MQKPMLTADELVRCMENKGIRFTITTEEEAKRHLCEHNNYFKLTAYRKNYTKRTSGEKEGQYENLEFAYLQELARIDTEIRHILLDMALDIEHFLKVALIKAVEERKGKEGEDGYKILTDYLNNAGNEEKTDYDETVGRRKNAYRYTLDRNMRNHYCKGLVEKYREQMPIWAFVELISFGELNEIVGYYAERTDWKVPVDIKSLERVRQIRNACAHGNCIIYDLRPDETTNGKSYAPRHITNYVNRAGIRKTSASKKLSNPRIGQIVHLIYVYDTMVTSANTRNRRIEQLRELVLGRCKQHKLYFDKNPLLTSTYEFFVKLIDAVK